MDEGQSKNGSEHEDLTNGKIEHVQNTHQKGEWDGYQGIGAAKHDTIKKLLNKQGFPSSDGFCLIDNWELMI